MKIFICLISSNEKINAIYGKANRALIPKEFWKSPILNGAELHIEMKSFNPTKGTSLDEFLLSEVKTFDAAILVIEQGQEYVASAVRDAFFSAIVPIAEPIPSPQNFFAAIFAKLLKNFLNLWEIMSESANEQAMLLPLRNFAANDLQSLAVLCRDNFTIGPFKDNVKTLTSSLKGRRRPQRRSNSKRMHFVDDQEKLFEYGHEDHSRHATGTPHAASCDIAGNFRFGKRFAPERHFNVFKEVKEQTSISGSFPDCHGALVVVPERRHINMFSNDYH